MVVCLLASLAHAEKLRLFRASETGADAWIWGGARIKEKLGKLLISEHNKRGETGDVFTADRLPYFEDAVIELDVDQVIAGSYSFQVLGFINEDHKSTIELVTASTDPGRNTFSLKGRNMAEGVNRIAFKFWVGDAEGASMKLNDLVYTLRVDEEKIALDHRFRDKEEWQEENLLIGLTAEGAGLSVLPGKTFGAVLRDQRIERADVDTVIFELDDVSGGDVTLQLVAFDPENNYLESFNAIKKVTSGIHAVRLQDLPFPGNADWFAVKIWLGGGVSAKATLKRILIVKP
jgi:hypothetical protein